MKETFYVTKTPNGVRKWPLHTHAYWEIMLYLSGNGFMLTDEGKIPFEKGTVIVVPPFLQHGSTSNQPFINISVGGDFGEYFTGKSAESYLSDENGDETVLAELLLKNVGAPLEHVGHVLYAYLSCVAERLAKTNSSADFTLNAIRETILRSFSDCNFSVSAVLFDSGYSPDYIRHLFTVRYGASPVAFLQNIRIQKAVRLFEVYGNRLPVGKIAELCGFSDPVYFSKLFKARVGVSPSLYRTRGTKV